MQLDAFVQVPPRSPVFRGSETLCCSSRPVAVSPVQQARERRDRSEDWTGGKCLRRARSRVARFLYLTF